MGPLTYRVPLVLAVLAGALGTPGRGQTRRPVPIAVVVNELMAANRQTLADGQGEFDDWIELYNTGGTAVDLAGCYLTDDLTQPTKWQIPTNNAKLTTIAAHGYLLVWADGEVWDPGLHAGFKLNDAGEQVGLFAADGVTCLNSLAFGPQQADVSYGRATDGGPELRTIASPTPGTANAVLYEGVVAAPRISIATGLYAEPFTVEITTATAGATIHFSVDGSDPLQPNPTRSRSAAALGSVYTAPLSITRSTTLKAVAVKSGWRPSDVRTTRYLFLGPEVRRFSSPLPIAIIDTQGQAVSTVPTPACACFFDLGANGRATTTGRVDFLGPAALNVRGKSSAGFAKKQYHLETQDERGNDRDVSILGFVPESDWVLQGMYSDKSLMRNVLAYQWSNELGRWAAHTRFLELFLHAGQAEVTMADYLGVYVFMEKIKVGKNRVAIAPLGPEDNAEPAISGGYLIAKDKLDADDQTFSTSRGQSLIFKDPSGAELTADQKNWIRNYVNAFEAALYGPGFTDPAHGYAKYIDVGSFIDNHILVELTKNIDGFRLSTYFHKDRNGKLVMGPVWDYDLSLGNANYNDGGNATGWYHTQLDDGAYPYWRRLFEDPEFQLQYADRWFALRRGRFTTPRLVGTVESYATLLDEPAARNYVRWPTLGLYVWPNYFIAKTYREEITWMQGWLAGRLTWLDGQVALEFAPAPPAFNREGGPVRPGFELTMTAAGPIYYTLDGSDPRARAGPILPPTGTTLVPQDAPKRVLAPTGPVADAWRGGGRFSDAAWTPVAGGPGPIGFDQSTRGTGLFSLNTKAAMYGVTASCLIRVPFAFPGQPRDLAGLTLRIRYNDGFVAYLNGVEIARRNFTGTPAWNAAADAPWSNTADYEDIPIVNWAACLRPGDNLLAIQGLNASAMSTDFVIAAQLLTQERAELQTPAGVRTYTGPVRLEEPAQIRARAVVGGRWSALNEAVFTLDPAAQP
jgi:hypothetical protein